MNIQIYTEPNSKLKQNIYSEMNIIKKVYILKGLISDYKNIKFCFTKAFSTFLFHFSVPRMAVPSSMASNTIQETNLTKLISHFIKNYIQGSQ